ncbi:type VI secretion system baseplate subunit TssK [Ningiella sp. W23]|uniref:type VI secretion system baseplate subunit TssK n=1 Tax=Ningiella sp. W23 TaxID=3023715 RepID=UPI0037569A32
MTWEKRVVWSEGMMLQPQHFQQQARYHDAQLRDTLHASIPYAWGQCSVGIDSALLKTGKFCVHEGEGVLRDGSVYRFPERDQAPAPIDVSKNELGHIIYLAVPIRRNGSIEVQRDDDSNTRFAVSEYETRDVSGLTKNKALLEVGGLRFVIRTSAQDNSEFTCVAIAKIEDVSPSGLVTLDENFIAPSLNIKDNHCIRGFVNELLKLCHHRIHALASRVSVAGKSTGSEITDYMLLQTLNRHLPSIHYFNQAEQLHPFYLYEKLCALIGDMSTFIKADKLVPQLPHYDHEQPSPVFKALIGELRSLFSVVLEQNSINIPLQERKFGIRVGTVADKTLFESASFILAVSADVSAEDLMKYFPAQSKIGAVESIKELVNLQLPGIQLTHLAAAPREVPYQRNFVYFELVQSGEYWAALSQSGGIAIHISADFPNLSIELWAIRS